MGWLKFALPGALVQIPRGRRLPRALPPSDQIDEDTERPVSDLWRVLDVLDRCPVVAVIVDVELVGII